MTRLPMIVTHNYDVRYGPFRNVCDLSDDEAEKILREQREPHGRSLKPHYMARRRATEVWLRQESRVKLGRTPLERPIYFFVGDFSDGKDPVRPNSIKLDLAELPPMIATFTYTDSMASYLGSLKANSRCSDAPFFGLVFTRSEIEAIVSRYGMPQTGFIEMQLWDDLALRSVSILR